MNSFNLVRPTRREIDPVALNEAKRELLVGLLERSGLNEVGLPVHTPVVNLPIEVPFDEQRESARHKAMLQHDAAARDYIRSLMAATLWGAASCAVFTRLPDGSFGTIEPRAFINSNMPACIGGSVFHTFSQDSAVRAMDEAELPLWFDRNEWRKARDEILGNTNEEEVPLKALRGRPKGSRVHDDEDRYASILALLQQGEALTVTAAVRTVSSRASSKDGNSEDAIFERLRKGARGRPEFAAYLNRGN